MIRKLYVALFSNATQSLYPHNTIGSFTVDLPRPIELGPNDKREVGLWEKSDPPNRVGTLQSVSVVGDPTILVYTDLISPQYVEKKISDGWERSFILHSMVNTSTIIIIISLSKNKRLKIYE